MPELRIGIQLKSLNMPFKQAVAAAARLGARGVEINARGELRPGALSRTAERHLRKLLDDLGLRVAAVGFHTRSGYDVDERIDERVEATKAAMRLAAQLGAPVVVNQVGRVPQDADDRRFALLVAALTDLGLYGQHVGAMLAAETGSESGPDLARLVDALPEGLIVVDFNPGQLIVNGFSPSEAVSALGPAIMHVHATDAVRDQARGRGIEVPLGRGVADFPELCAALEQYEYRGFFTIAREHAADPVAEIGDAVEYLRSM